MGLIKLEKGQILHKAGTDIVETIEVVVKGSLKISNQYTSIVMSVGGFIGIVETPGSTYKYNIEALDEAAVYSYPFESENDIPNVVKSNPKIAPILAAQSVEAAIKCCDVYEKEYEDATSEYDQVITDYTDYPNLCIKVGEVPKEFPEIKEIIAPEQSDDITEWSFEFIRSLKKNEASLKRTFYPLSIEIATGVVMCTYEIYTKISRESQLLIEYRNTLKKKTAAFATTMKAIRAKLNNLENNNGTGEGSVTVVNALSTILQYANVAPEISVKFEEQLSQFKAMNNRYDSADEARALRRNIATTFYEVYTPAFLKSLGDDNVPMEVRMFFMFGFVDEKIQPYSTTWPKPMSQILKARY